MAAAATGYGISSSALDDSQAYEGAPTPCKEYSDTTSAASPAASVSTPEAGVTPGNSTVFQAPLICASPYQPATLSLDSSLGSTGSLCPALDTGRVRTYFPAFKHHPDVLFFDNASTAQKPQTVIDTITGFYERECANAGRASYSLASRLTRKVQESREAVAQFINADVADIAFTSGATDSLNLVASLWGLKNLKSGDEVLVCLEDHSSAVLPWFNLQSMLKRFGIDIAVVPFAMHATGTYDRKSLASSLSDRTRLIALSHVHHLYGMEMDLPELKELIPENVLISLDASQSIGHTRVNVSELGVHFLSFSGHKMFAANGTGVLWVDSDVRADLMPARVGAKSAVEMGSDGFNVDTSTLSGLIECGTLNLPGILSFAPAVEFIHSLGMESIEKHLSHLTRYLYTGLKKIPGIEFAPGIGVCGCTRGYGIIGFRLAQTSALDLAAYLDSEAIFVRAGDHCLSSGSEDFARVSLHVYNTLAEIDRFLEVLVDAAC